MVADYLEGLAKAAVEGRYREKEAPRKFEDKRNRL
jgi:hypothetical protein